MTKSDTNCVSGELKWSSTAGEEMLPKKSTVPCASVDTLCFASGIILFFILIMIKS